MQFTQSKGQPVQDLLKQNRVPEDQALFPQHPGPAQPAEPEPAYW